ncbi:MAG: hypothetical protein K8H88_17070, partial [Sandaracinaceae bacterium]|nr:hypothetical protein [Sandaracinaceae bacterium]
MQRHLAEVMEQQLQLADKEREREARVLALETEVARLTRELVGRKSEKLKIPPADREAKKPPT